MSPIYRRNKENHERYSWLKQGLFNLIYPQFLKHLNSNLVNDKFLDKKVCSQVFFNTLSSQFPLLQRKYRHIQLRCHTSKRFDCDGKTNCKLAHLGYKASLVQFWI